MGTSKNLGEVAAKMDLAADNIRAARTASFRAAETAMRPRFRDEARAAAGNDRTMRNKKGVLDANFQIVNGRTTTVLFISPTGPWGIRDNTDIGGKTKAHVIRARNPSKSIVFINHEGDYIATYTVHHPGSAREPFWGRARQFSFRFMQKRIPEETIAALTAALNRSGFKGRM
jgi:hypothetical protein